MWRAHELTWHRAAQDQSVDQRPVGRSAHSRTPTAGWVAGMANARGNGLEEVAAGAFAEGLRPATRHCPAVLGHRPNLPELVCVLHKCARENRTIIVVSLVLFSGANPKQAGSVSVCLCRHDSLLCLLHTHMVPLRIPWRPLRSCPVVQYVQRRAPPDSDNAAFAQHRPRRNRCRQQRRGHSAVRDRGHRQHPRQ